jgi:hypothetical protein
MARYQGLAIAAIMIAYGGSASALEFVQNGNFNSISGEGALSGGANTVTDWVDNIKPGGGAAGQDFVYATGTADTAALPVGGAYHDNGELYGEFDGGVGAAATWAGTSDGTANFVGLNGGVNRSLFTQTIGTGGGPTLVQGQQYVLSFNYAFAQGFRGTAESSNDSITVGLGAFSTSTSPVISLAAKDFSGWQTFTQTITYDGSSNANVLSFLAEGMDGAPPYALLDNVSLTSFVPEPSAWALMLLGFGGMGLMVRRRRAASLAA